MNPGCKTMGTEIIPGVVTTCKVRRRQVISTGLVKIAFGILLFAGCSDRHSSSASQVAHDLKLIRLSILTGVLEEATNIINESLLFDTEKLRTDASQRIWLLSTNYALWKETALDQNVNQLDDIAVVLFAGERNQAFKITFGGQLTAWDGKTATAALLRISEAHRSTPR
jgi:hypothetical protein